jgi:hypothetical protein
MQAPNSNSTSTNFRSGRRRSHHLGIAALSRTPCRAKTDLRLTQLVSRAPAPISRCWSMRSTRAARCLLCTRRSSPVLPRASRLPPPPLPHDGYRNARVQNASRACRRVRVRIPAGGAGGEPGRERGARRVRGWCALLRRQRGSAPPPSAACGPNTNRKPSLHVACFIQCCHNRPRQAMRCARPAASNEPTSRQGRAAPRRATRPHASRLGPTGPATRPTRMHANHGGQCRVGSCRVDSCRVGFPGTD